MMNVLDALRYKLTLPGTTDLEGEQIDPALLEAMGLRGPRRQQQPLPPGLPLGVQDSILNRPSYQEGDRPPPLPAYEPNLPRDDPRSRDYRLNDMIGFGRFMKEQGGWAWPENQFATPLEEGQSPYATRLPSALNQLMRRLPYGQY